MDNRHRKAPYHRQDWRSKAQTNQSLHRYKREFILKHYQNLPPPPIACRDQIIEIVFDEPNPPLLNAFFPFTQPFGEEPNSRKYPQREKKPEQMPEWYQDDESKIESKPAKSENPERTEIEEGLMRNNEDNDLRLERKRMNRKIDETAEIEIEDRFSKIDLQVEQKLKMEKEDENEEAPEWDEPEDNDFEFAGQGKEAFGSNGNKASAIASPAQPIQIQISPSIAKSDSVPKPTMSPPVKVPQPFQASSNPHPSHSQIPRAPVYDINLIKYHFAIANPFAQILINFIIPLEGPAVSFTPGTKPFEKIWYYKDLEEKVHGPFSTLEMFNWTVRNCFPPDLQIALAPIMTFVPMYIFSAVPQEPEFYPDPGEQYRHKGKKDYKKYQKSDEPATLHLKTC